MMNSYSGLRKKSQPTERSFPSTPASTVSINLAEDILTKAIVDKEVLKLRSLAVINNLRTKLGSTEELFASAKEDIQQLSADNHRQLSPKRPRDLFGANMSSSANAKSSHGNDRSFTAQQLFPAQLPIPFDFSQFAKPADLPHEKNELLASLQSECNQMQTQILYLMQLLEKKTEELNESKVKFSHWLQCIQIELESHITIVAAVTEERDKAKEELSSSQSFVSAVEEENGLLRDEIASLKRDLIQQQAEKYDMQQQINSLQQRLFIESSSKTTIEKEYDDIKSNLESELAAIHQISSIHQISNKKVLSASADDKFEVMGEEEYDEEEEDNRTNNSAIIVDELECKLNLSMQESASLIDGWARAQKEKELEIKTLQAAVLDKEITIEKLRLSNNELKVWSERKIEELEQQLEELQQSQIQSTGGVIGGSGHRHLSLMQAAAAVGSKISSSVSVVGKILPTANSASKASKDREGNHSNNSEWSDVLDGRINTNNPQQILSAIASQLASEAKAIGARSIAKANSYESMAKLLYHCIDIIGTSTAVGSAALTKDNEGVSVGTSAITATAMTSPIAATAIATATVVTDNNAIDDDNLSEAITLLSASSALSSVAAQQAALQQLLMRHAHAITDLIPREKCQTEAVSEIVADITAFLSAEAAAIMGRSVSKATEFNQRVAALQSLLEAVHELSEYLTVLQEKTRMQIEQTLKVDLVRQLCEVFAKYQREIDDWKDRFELCSDEKNRLDIAISGCKEVNSKLQSSLQLQSAELVRIACEREEAVSQLELLQNSTKAADKELSENEKEKSELLFQSYVELLEEKHVIIAVQDRAIHEQERQYTRALEEIRTLKQDNNNSHLREITYKREQLDQSLQLAHKTEEVESLKAQLSEWVTKFNDTIESSKAEIEQLNASHLLLIEQKDEEIRELMERPVATAKVTATAEGQEAPVVEDTPEQAIANALAAMDEALLSDASSDSSNNALREKLVHCASALRDLKEQYETQQMRIGMLLRNKTQLQHENGNLTRKSEESRQQYALEITTLARMLTAAQQEIAVIKSELNEKRREAECALEDKESLQNYVSDIQTDLDNALAASEQNEAQWRLEANALSEECDLLRSQLKQFLSDATNTEKVEKSTSAELDGVAERAAERAQLSVLSTPRAIGFSSTKRLLLSTGRRQHGLTAAAVSDSYGAPVAPTTPLPVTTTSNLSDRIVSELKTKYSSLRKLRFASDELNADESVLNKENGIEDCSANQSERQTTIENITSDPN